MYSTYEKTYLNRWTEHKHIGIKSIKKWGVSRATIYKKIDEGEFSRNSDKKVDTAEMLRVFVSLSETKRIEQTIKSVQLKHQLEKKKQFINKLF